MIKINLLPYRDIQKKEKVWFQIFLMIGTVVFAFIIVGVVHWRVVAYESDLTSMREEINREIVELDKKIGQIDQIKNQKSEIERKLSVIDMLNFKRVYAAEFLFKTADAVPDKVWLLSIEERDKDVVFTGESELATHVSSFMERLNSSELFQKVTLVSLEQVVKADHKIIKFILNAAKVERGAKS